MAFRCCIFSNYDTWFVLFQFMVGMRREFPVIFLNSFRCVFTSFGSSWKSIYYAHNPVNNFSQSILLPWAVLLLCKHFTFSNHMADFLFIFSTVHIGLKDSVCQLCYLCCFFSVLGLMLSLTFTLRSSSIFPLLTRSKFLGSSFHPISS